MQQNSNLTRIFSVLGADTRETATFLKLLELGAQPVSSVARYVGVPRTTMYTILARLTSLQLIEEFKRDGIMYVHCLPLEDIERLFTAKQKALDAAADGFKENMGELKVLQNRRSVTPRVMFFEGKKAVPRLYNEVLKEKKFASIFNPHLVKKFMPEFHFEIPQMLRDRKIAAREILTDCDEAHEYKRLFESSLHQIKIMAPSADGVMSDIIIGEKKIYMVAYDESDISAVEITNERLTQSHRAIFEKLWETLM